MFDFLKKKINSFVDKVTKKETPAEIPKEEPKEKPLEEPEIKQEIEEIKEEVQKIVKKETPEPVKIEPVKDIKKDTTVEKPKERIKVGAISTIKSIFTNEVEISQKDIEDLLEEFEIELLESDVDIEVAEAIKTELSEKLVGSKIKKGELHHFVNKIIKETLISMMSHEKFDIVDFVKESQKPVRIMFLGINGAGKTTTIAKVAKLLLDNDLKVVFAAADTFRAAAIEQLQVHADRLNVKVIKREYGSDPTSVAYDATNYAKAHGIDAVLIDTAGRQDTNVSLINEIKKMNRVIEPELKIYIGESVAGNAILAQISSFNSEIGLDSVILTKLDCDPKGGTMISINKVTGIPIIYLGVGQKYDDLEKFDAVLIAGRIVG